MKAGTIIMLIIILALLCLTCFLVAKSVQLANARAARVAEQEVETSTSDPQS